MSTANAPVRRRLQNARRPLLVWTGVVAYLGVVTLMVSTIMPTDFVDASQAGFFEMQGWIAMSVLGAIGVFLSTRTGFPDPVSGEISPWRRFGLPVAIGLIGGVIFISPTSQPASRGQQPKSTICRLATSASPPPSSSTAQPRCTSRSCFDCCRFPSSC
jgi:hypothetical protein